MVQSNLGSLTLFSNQDGSSHTITNVEQEGQVLKVFVPEGVTIAAGYGGQIYIPIDEQRFLLSLIEPIQQQQVVVIE